MEHEELKLLAKEKAENYSPMTQNHSPSLWHLMRRCFADGFISGYRAAQQERAADEFCTCGGKVFRQNLSSVGICIDCGKPERV